MVWAIVHSFLLCYPTPAYQGPQELLWCVPNLCQGDKQEIQGEVKDIQSQKYLQKKPQNTKHVKQNIVTRQRSDYYHNGSFFFIKCIFYQKIFNNSYKFLPGLFNLTKLIVYIMTYCTPVLYLASLYNYQWHAGLIICIQTKVNTP